MPRPDWLVPYIVRPDAGLTWDSIVGLDHVKTALQSLSRRIEAAPANPIVAGTLPRGVLLHGDPGTGKTMTARVLLSTLAREAPAGLTMVNLPAADMTVARFADLTAWLNNRHEEGDGGLVLLFLDEIDVWAKKNGGPMAQPRNPVLLAALVCLDGIDQRDRAAHRTIAIMATNTPPFGLDPALTRSGRTDLIVAYPLPELDERTALFARFLAPVSRLGEPELRRAARLIGSRTSPADIVSVVNEAVGLSLDGRGVPDVTWPDLEAALRRQGHVEPLRLMSDEAQRRVQLHESGHILLSARRGIPVSMAIIHANRSSARGSGLTETDEGHDDTRDGLLAQLDVSMAGLAAEQVVLGDGAAGTGSGFDIGVATSIARRLARTGHLVAEGIPPVVVGESFAAEDLFLGVGGRVVTAALDRARRAVLADLPTLLATADAIGAKGSLTADEIEALVA
jgi:cell division protease FtsH